MKHSTLLTFGSRHCNTQHNDTRSHMTLIIICLFVTFSINDTQHDSVKCRYAEWRILFVMLNVIMLWAVMLSVSVPNRLKV
jgi:hypothetical protein